MALTKLEAISDAANRLLIGINISGYVLAQSLGASTAESITVPPGANVVNLTGTANFYANFSAVAEVPSDTTDGSASTLNPGMRKITGVTTISVISAETCIVTAEFWS